MRGGFSAGRTPAGRADLGAIARPRLTDPFGTLHDAVQTGFADVPWPPQYLPGRVQLERNLARAGRGIGILIDNAGIAKSAMLAATDDELWNELVAANLTGPFLCTRAAPSALLEAGAGRVDNVASTAALVGYPHVAAYCAAKHGAVPDCACVASPDDERGAVVEAFVVLQPGIEGGEVLTREHQELVKQAALHKYPRAVEYVDALPRTETGKLQRFRLRQLEEQRASERGTA